MTQRPRRLATATWVFALAVAAVALVGIFYYGERLRQNASWVDALDDWPETRLDEKTFALLVAQRLIAPDVDPSGEIVLRLASCENSDDETSARRGAFDLLCHSPYGEIIRADVEAWNASGHFLAVRDNRSPNDRCEGELDPSASAPRVYLAAGCKPTHWRIARALAKGGLATTRLLPGAGPPAQDFGALGGLDSQSAYQSDWAFADGGRDPDASFVLTTDGIDVPPNQAVTIDVVARARQIVVAFDLGAGARKLTLRLNPDASVSSAARDGVELSARRICADIPIDAQSDATIDARQDAAPGVDVCASEPAKAPFAYVIGLSYAAKSQAPAARFGVEIEASPIGLSLSARALGRARADNRSAAAAGRDRLLANAGGATFAFHPQGHIVARCPMDATTWTSLCRLSWATREFTRAPSKPMLVRVGFADAPDADLIEPNTGRIGEGAFDLGLADILGLDRADYGALSWAMAQKRQSLTILSIRRAMQMAVRDTLFGEGGECRKRRAPGADERLCAKLKARRNTATIVLMDADQEPGAIRAIASWPGLPRHRNIWDLSALEQTEHADAGLGWRLLSAGQRPGSTFKLVTGLASIDAALGQGLNIPLADPTRAQLGDLLAGAMPLTGSPSEPNAAAFLGLAHGEGKLKCKLGKGPLDVATAPVGPRASSLYWCVHNVDGADFADEAEPSGRGACPAKLPPGLKQMGLCEAIARSSNLFFAGLARVLAMAEPRRTTSALEDVARRLSFDFSPCNPNRAGSGRCGFDLTRGLLGASRAGRLRADPVAFDRLRNLRDALTSGFGDAQSATALAMTTIYASFATGRLVRPSLVALARDSSGCPNAPLQHECEPLSADRQAVAPYQGLIRTGLNAVITDKNGTAHRKFGPTRFGDRLFAKTGTASYRGLTFDANSHVRVRALNALWLVGWIEGDGGAGPLGHRLAFGCHVAGSAEKTFGADFCAPAIAELLKRLDGGASP